MDIKLIKISKKNLLTHLEERKREHNNKKRKMEADIGPIFEMKIYKKKEFPNAFAEKV